MFSTALVQSWELGTLGLCPDGEIDGAVTIHGRFSHPVVEDSAALLRPTSIQEKGCASEILNLASAVQKMRKCSLDPDDYLSMNTRACANEKLLECGELLDCAKNDKIRALLT